MNNQNDMLQDFMSLVERYDPDFTRKIKGASQKEIDQLAKLVRRPLPESYRQFLACMGRGMGGLEIEGVDFLVERVIDFYADEKWVPPPDYILFAIQDDDPQMDYYLECMNSVARDCPVVRFPSQGEFSRSQYFDSLDPSLVDFLLSLGFSEKRMEDFELQRMLSPAGGKHRREPGIASEPMELTRIIDERARRLGFDRVARSSVAYRFYDHSDSALYVRLDDMGGLMGVTIAARKSRELERLSDILSSKTSLVT